MIENGSHKGEKQFCLSMVLTDIGTILRYHIKASEKCKNEDAEIKPKKYHKIVRLSILWA